jgi:serine/threonine protein kinase
MDFWKKIAVAALVSNILLDQRGTCKLADFGSSKKIYGQMVSIKDVKNIELKLHISMRDTILDAT